MSNSGPKTLLERLEELEGLRSDGPKGHGKRQYDRHLVRGEAELTPIELERLDVAPMPVQLRDIGRGGVGFIVDGKVETFGIYRLSIVQSGYVVTSMPIVIRHARRVDDNLHLVGGQCCADSGLLQLAGVPMTVLRKGDSHTVDDDAAFLPPGEVA